jgi:outer membrane protein
MSRISKVFLGISAGAIGLAAPAAALTLPEALSQAYRTNPTVDGARAGQRATDEGVVAAKAAALPTLSANVGYDEFLRQPANDPTAPRRQLNGSVQASLPLYAGGGTINAVRAAEARVRGGRQTLRSAEDRVMVDAVTAYLSVFTDQAIVDFYIRQLALLEENIAYARSGFSHGDLTRTDIDQAQARRELADGQLENARGNLDASREEFFRIVGAVPTNLERPAAFAALPASLSQALEEASGHNPGLEGARQARRAAGYQVRVAAASRAPRLGVVASSGYSNFFNSFGGVTATRYDQVARNSTVALQASIPLYQGGLPAARIREAKAVEDQAITGISETERTVNAQVRSNFYRLQSGRRAIEAAKRAIDSSEQALKGVRTEIRVGTRSVLDLLNAEQEVLSARIQLAQAERDTFIAGFALLADMGHADPESLGLPGVRNYDPATNYDRVRSRFWDYGTGGGQ